LKYKRETNSDIKLVLLGKPVAKIPQNSDIISLGFVSEVDKYNAILASELLVMPSKYESLSMVLLESWVCKKPCLVNGESPVLKSQCIKSNGGLWYENYDEFKSSLNLLLANDKMREKLGENGKRYVQKNYSRDIIESKYLRLLENLYAQKL
jgi:glycosyltransferase involved in cell wall biosynthesis